jgi:chorismate-pyruvate lyase
MPPSPDIAAMTDMPPWPDTPDARAEAFARLQALNAELLAHASATLTLERWCAAHAPDASARIVAERMHGEDRPLPADLRARIGVAADTPVKYRHVRLTCAGRVLSEAENWYLSGRLDAAMNHRLDHTDTPFGKAVLALDYRRQTLSVEWLWSPAVAATDAAAMRDAASPTDGGALLAIPAEVLRHRALLLDADDRPFAALVETYTGQVLAFAQRAAQR